MIFRPLKVFVQPVEAIMKCDDDFVDNDDNNNKDKNSEKDDNDGNNKEGKQVSRKLLVQSKKANI